MQAHLSKPHVRSERGEVASWLILAAGLALAAVIASSGLGTIIASLVGNVGDAAGVEVEVAAGPAAPGGPNAPGPGDDGSGDDGLAPGSPSGPDGPNAPGPGDDGPGDDGSGDDDSGGGDPRDDGPGSPSGPDGPGAPGPGGPGEPGPGDGGPGPGDGSPPSSDPSPDDAEPQPEQRPVPDCFVENDSRTHIDCTPPCSDDYWSLLCWTDAGCLQTPINHCFEDGTCNSFTDNGCSRNPQVYLAIQKGEHYKRCSNENPSIILCNNYPRGFETGTAALLRAEIGADPGDMYLLAAAVCADNHPGCAFALDLADWYHDNRQWVAAAVLAGDLIPAPPGVKCAVAAADGFSGGDAAECLFGFATGLDVPFPSGAIDDLLEDE